MKKGFLLIIIISLVVYGSFGAADLSEAKDKLSKYDRQILEEFNLSFKDSSEGRFQTAKIDDTSILIIDTKFRSFMDVSYFTGSVNQICRQSLSR